MKSTYRPSCMIENRKTKGSKNASKVRCAGKKIRVTSCPNKLGFDLHNDKIRTEKLLETALHARQQVRKNGRRDFRALDVAGDMNMEEDLQVRLLSAKHKDKRILEASLSGCESYQHAAILSMKSRQNGAISSSITSERDFEGSSKRSKIKHSKLDNGDIKIEAFATVNGNSNANTSEQAFRDGINKLEAGLKSCRDVCVDSKIILQKRPGDVLKFNGDLDNSNCRLLQDNIVFCKDKVKDLASRIGFQSCTDSSLLENCNSSVYHDELLHGSVSIKVNDGEVSLNGADDVSCQTIDASEKTSILLQTSESKSKEKNANLDNQSEEIGLDTLVYNCNCEKLKKFCVHNTSVARKVFKAESDCRRKTECSIEQGKTPEIPNLNSRPKRRARNLRCAEIEECFVKKRKNKGKGIQTNKKRKQDKVVLETDQTARTKRRTNKKPNIKDTQSEDSKLCPESIPNKKVDGKSNSKIGPVEEDTHMVAEDVEEVLGIKISEDGTCNVLVQFKDGTSNWMDKLQLDSIKEPLVDYFSFSSQDLSVVHRPLFSIYDEPVENCLHIDSVNLYPEDSKVNISKDRLEEVHTISPSSLQADLGSCPENICCLPEPTLQTIPEGPDLSVVEDSAADGMVPLVYENWSGDLKNDVFDDDNEIVRDEERCSDTLAKSNKVFISKNGELEVLESDFTQIVLKHKDKRSKRIRVETCDNLIQQLELRSTDENSSFVVIYGLEEYFASTMDMERIQKFPAHSESTRYDERITSLR